MTCAGCNIEFDDFQEVIYISGAVYCHECAASIEEEAER